MKQRSGSSSLSALKLKSFSSLVKWCAVHYTRHMKGHVSLTGSLWVCVNARTDSGKSLAVWMQQIWRSGNKSGTHYPCIFPESLCERGLRENARFIVSRTWYQMKKRSKWANISAICAPEFMWHNRSIRSPSTLLSIPYHNTKEDRFPNEGSMWSLSILFVSSWKQWMRDVWTYVQY